MNIFRNISDHIKYSFGFGYMLKIHWTKIRDHNRLMEYAESIVEAPKNKQVSQDFLRKDIKEWLKDNKIKLRIYRIRGSFIMKMIFLHKEDVVLFKLWLQ